MKIGRKLTAIAMAATFAASATVVWAGTAITGTGSTPAAAMDDANNRAAQESSRRWGRGTCYTPAKYESCRKADGFWVCTAYVNNEAGSAC